MIRKTLEGEGELNLFTILQTAWNLQLQTGTETQLKRSKENRSEVDQRKWI